MLYVNSSGELIFQNGSSSTTIGAAGSGGTPSWETVFAADATMTITPDATFTIAGNRSTATDVLTLTNVAGGSGSVLQITNSGSGNDVDGTSNTWSVSKAGAATFLTLTLSGTTITSTAADVAWALEDNDATALSIGAAGETDMMVFDTRTGVETVTFNNNLNLTGGIATFVSASNTVSNVLVTNNTATTWGAAANDAGVVSVGSTSLTTGSLLQLNLSDTALAGGFYLTCRETVGGTNDFTIGENGVIAMTGTAASDALAITLGNITLSDGLLTVTSTGTADVVSVTANSLLSNNLAIFQGSGTFTGTGTGSFFAITPTGLTTGTALTVIAVLASTSVAVVDIQTLGLTSGTALRVQGTTATFTTGGTLVELDTVAAVAGNHLTATTTGAYTGTGMILVTAGAATTGILVSLVSTTGMTSGSLLRGTTSTAGAVATNGIFSMRATGAYTSTSNVGLLDVSATATITGTVVHFTATAAMTSGQILNVTQTGTTTLFTGNMVQFTSSHTSGGGNTLAVIGVHTTAGNGVSIVNNALTLGSATSLLVSHTTSVLGAGTSLVRISSTGVDTGTTTGVLFDLSTTSAAGSTQIMLTDSSAATGARIGILSKITNAAAVLAVPIKSSNVAVTGTGSKFTRHVVVTDGTKTCTIWLNLDNTEPEGALTGVKGDLMLNCVGGAPAYCDADGTNWTTLT